MEFVNLTNKRQTLIREDGAQFTVPTSGTVAKVRTHLVRADLIEGVPLYRQEAVDGEGIPDFTGDTMYLVTPEVGAAMRRKDLMSVNADGSLRSWV